MKLSWAGSVWRIVLAGGRWGACVTVSRRHVHRRPSRLVQLKDPGNAATGGVYLRHKPVPVRCVCVCVRVCARSVGVGRCWGTGLQSRVACCNDPVST